MADGGEIIVVPFQASGHIYPAIDLSNRLASRNYRITLLLPSIPSDASLHPLIRMVEFLMPLPPDAPPGPPPPAPSFSSSSSSPSEIPSSFADFLARRFDGTDPSPRPICAIVDVMLSQLLDDCREFQIPAVSFFTASACSTALDHAASKLLAEDVDPVSGWTVTIPGLPEEMVLTSHDLKHRKHTPPGHAGHGGPPPHFGPGHGDVRPPGTHPPPGPGHFGRPPPPFRAGDGSAPPPLPGPGPHGSPPARPDKRGPGGPFRMWGLDETNGTIALFFNTCDDLERPFLDYVAQAAKMTVWGVGPLVPDAFWSAAGSLVRDATLRPKRDDSRFSEREVLEWLDSKPRCSVIYVSFGSIVAPSEAELAALVAGLEESNRHFIWAFQPQAMLHDTEGIPVQTPGGWEPAGLASRVGGRGLVIRGWAPQLLILSHRATGGFLTHCGWNSTVEALGCGVPMLTWPVHGDQNHNAKLVTRRLRAGIAIKSGSEPVSKDDVLRGIERLMAGEEGVKERAASARAIFAGGFPRTSSASLDAFLDFVKRPHQSNN